MSETIVKVKSREDLVYATPGSSGVDLKYCPNPMELNEFEKIQTYPGTSGKCTFSDIKCVLPPGKRVLLKTGVYLEMPQNVEAQIRSRSGLAYKYGVVVLNSPGTIDADYRGELGVILYNSGSQPYTCCVGDRIAQLVFAPIIQPRFEYIKDMSSTQRGAGGFGSTGV